MHSPRCGVMAPEQTENTDFEGETADTYLPGGRAEPADNGPRLNDEGMESTGKVVRGTIRGGWGRGNSSRG